MGWKTVFGLALIVVVGCLAIPSRGQPTKITLGAYFTQPKDSPTSKRLEEIYRDVERASGGTVVLQERWAEEALRGPRLLAALGSGGLDVAVAPGNEFGDKLSIGKVSLLPGNFRRPNDRSRVFYDTEFGDIVDDVLRRGAGIRAIGTFNHFTGTDLLLRKGVTFKGLDDIKGLTVRAATPDSEEVLRRLGAKPLSLAPTDIYPALRAGKIDGVILPISTLESLKLMDVVGEVIGPDFVFSGRRMDFVQVNEKKWERIDPYIQGRIREAIRTAAVQDDERVTKILDAPVRAKASASGVKITSLAESDMRRILEIDFAIQTVELISKAQEQGFGADGKRISDILQAVATASIVDPFDGEVKYETYTDKVVFTYVLRDRSDVKITVVEQKNGKTSVLTTEELRLQPKGENQWIWMMKKGTKGMFRVIFEAKDVYRSGPHYRRAVLVFQ